ncbi:MAG: hypothetical protein FJW14_01285 [Acidimicrobiia bacterium]|nr:hypothetical protein [Acidimicrobiia bacterium]
MSEHQYYEFRAIDRVLTDRQMRELRAISTRAVISRTSFSNYYTFGDLKANPRDLLVKYFDASLYFANWLFLEVAFRYPKSALDLKRLRRYAAGPTVEVRSTGPDVVVAISVESDGESFDTADDATGWLASLMALRADIASGDDRALYLGWLFDVQCGEIEDDVVEPARPEELGHLNPALDSFIDIVGIDRDLVTVAAEGASPTAPSSATRDIHGWLAGLETSEHLTLLARIARGDAIVGAELRRRFRQHTQGRAAALPLRTAGELRARAEAIAERRRKTALEHEARERAAREREEQTARDRYLTHLGKRERRAWQQVEALIGTRRPADYAAAVELLVDLRDVSGRKGHGATFAKRIRALRLAHTKKPSLFARLRKAGL